MNKRVLIVYPYYNQLALMSNFSSKLLGKGIEADCICIANCFYIKNSQIRWPWWVNAILKLRKWIGFNKLGTAICILFNRYILNQLFRKYDLIDFHSFVESDYPYMEYCSKNNIPFDITLWGSDIMRASDDKIKRMAEGFDKCRLIKCAEGLYQKMLECYGNRYEQKRRNVLFGTSDFDTINCLSDDKIASLKQSLYGETNGKVIVACGYNGSRSQNHLEMIGALERLPQTLKNKMLVVLQMTYGASPEYLQQVRERIVQTDIPFVILDHFLSENEIAMVRRTSDIVVNIQDTDAFAGSIRAHLFCNNIVLVGNWLPYSFYLDKAGVVFYQTSMEDLTSSISSCITNLEAYRLNCSANQSKMYGLFSWESTINDWVSTYGE